MSSGISRSQKAAGTEKDTSACGLGWWWFLIGLKHEYHEENTEGLLGASWEIKHKGKYKDDLSFEML
jgi:hypothetical protein